MKEQLDRILINLISIEAKLDKVIKAMQEHDGVDEDFNDPYDEYGQYKVPPCVGHALASDKEESKPKPKKRYYKPKKKKDGNKKESS